MAHTAIDDPEFAQERYDSAEVLSEKVARLALMVRDSHRFVTFTGAGISTSAGIHDFRGPEGKWTRQAQGLEPLKGVSVVDAYPTRTHMALLELQRRGVLKYLISQNCDGLHRRSGIPAAAISELHGNGWVEICENCGLQHFRDFKCDRRMKEGGPKFPTDHFTGRFCSCGGRLLNSTIDFGQNLPEAPLERARQHSHSADLHLALGSSLRVTPACDQPKATVKTGGDLVIVNLQKTPLTDMATMHIFAETDKVMEMLMEQLSIEIPAFQLLRRVLVGKGAGVVYAKAVDVHDPTLEMGHICAVDWNGKGLPKRALENPMAGICRQQGGHKCKLEHDAGLVRLRLHFMGHYCEPPLDLEVDLANTEIVDTQLAFDPCCGEWTLLSQQNLSSDQLAALGNGVEARIPDYGPSQRQYCIDMVIRNRNCDSKTAAEIIDKRFAASRREAMAEAGISEADGYRRKPSPSRGPESGGNQRKPSPSRRR